MGRDTNDILSFLRTRETLKKKMQANLELNSLSKNWFNKVSDYQYSYNFDWLGLPIIQYPQDMIAVQEIIWQTKPDVVIETGVARGGSLVLSASILHLLNGQGKVIGVDIDIRKHNREAIEAHPLAFRINLVEGSSVDDNTVQEVESFIKPDDRVMVILDSNHTHDHVLKELEFYSALVTSECYLIVMDTVIEDMPYDYFPDRPWGVGNNPKTAVHQFLETNDRFQIDESIHNKLLITVAPDGYLKCIK